MSIAMAVLASAALSTGDTAVVKSAVFGEDFEGRPVKGRSPQPGNGATGTPESPQAGQNR